MAVPAGSISFRDLQSSVLKNGFNDNDRGDAKNWINARYGWLYQLKRWTFRKDAATVTLTAGSSALANVPAFMGQPETLQLSDGRKLSPLSWTAFDSHYFGSSVAPGTPEAYTIVNGTISVGPVPLVTDAACRLKFWRGLCHLDVDGNVAAGPMVEDTDYPALPAETHQWLVPGSKVSGLKLSNIPAITDLEGELAHAVEALSTYYLEDIRDAVRQMPRDPLAYY